MEAKGCSVMDFRVFLDVGRVETMLMGSEEFKAVKSEQRTMAGKTGNIMLKRWCLNYRWEKCNEEAEWLLELDKQISKIPRVSKTCIHLTGLNSLKGRKWSLTKLYLLGLFYWSQDKDISREHRVWFELSRLHCGHTSGYLYTGSFAK